MNDKILIGSIIAVSLLIGVSFTSVVGNNSIESDMKDSPLFNIRSSRAIDEESKDIACDYVGKGEESVLYIPKRDSGTALHQKFIEIIKQLDEDQLKQLIDFVNKQININNLESIENLDEIDIRYPLRTNILDKNYNNVANINVNNLNVNSLTEGIGPTIIEWQNGDCIFDVFLNLITLIPIAIFIYIALVILAPLIWIVFVICKEYNSYLPI